jgi:solute carrier family 25 protein 34/35
MPIAAQRSPWSEFVLGGTAAVGAICFTNPIDVVKTRMQLQGELNKGKSPYRGVFHALYTISKTEGIHGLQSGLPASCFWQFSNVAVRFGVYGVAKHHFDINEGTSYRYAKSMGLAAISGGLAALASNPFFILKTRFQAQSSVCINVGVRRSQKTLWEAFTHIGESEGWRGYFRGAVHILFSIIDSQRSI